MRVQLRMVQFESAEEFPQGLGATWEPVSIDLAENESIAHVQATLGGRNCGFNYLRAVTTVWILSAETNT